MRVKSSKDRANAEAARLELADRELAERRHRECRLAWYDFHCRMSDIHAALSEEHERKALELLSEKEEAA